MEMQTTTDSRKGTTMRHKAAGEKIAEGRIETVTYTGYIVEGGEFVSFVQVHGLPEPVTPLLVWS